MSVSFYCPCGFRGATFDEINAHTEPLPGGCCNCGGQRCMSCVFREMHDRCVDDCPACCPKCSPSNWEGDPVVAAYLASRGVLGRANEELDGEPCCTPEADQ